LENFSTDFEGQNKLKLIPAGRCTVTDHMTRCNNAYDSNPHHKNYENFYILHREKFVVESDRPTQVTEQLPS